MPEDDSVCVFATLMLAVQLPENVRFHAFYWWLLLVAYIRYVHLQEDNGPVLDVVFVHGLMGGPYRTWRIADDKTSSTSPSGLVEKIDEDAGKEGTCWPEEWLADDLPGTRLLTVKCKVITLHCSPCK